MSLTQVNIHFDRPLRSWDGFGFNYVETAQTKDYTREPQDYGGFSILAEEQRQQIMQLVFGEDGLRPGLLKMFLDPWHQPEPEAPGDRSLQVDAARYDHHTTTRWMRAFAKTGAELTRRRGQELEIITTLYGPPGWMTRQRSLRGRDLDPAYQYACARYMVAWAKYLTEEEGLPVRYISVHNEGEDYPRWTEDGYSDWDGHDYNLYWPPAQVCEFLRMGKSVLEASDLSHVSFTPGETTNWLRFYEWGYASAIAQDQQALSNLGLVTSHGFNTFAYSRWFADWRSTGIDLLREGRPDLHAWVTSTSWSNMDVFMLLEMRHNIYAAKVNGIIPWAGIQRSNLWKAGDPNPGTAIRVHENGTFQVEPGYYYYKQVCRAGQPGMTVAPAFSNDTEVIPMAFGCRMSSQPEAFVLLNTSTETKRPEIILSGAGASGYDLRRTSPSEQYAYLGSVSAAAQISVELPPLSATTFFGSRG
jgi:hypothetical protein